MKKILNEQWKNLQGQEHNMYSLTKEWIELVFILWCEIINKSWTVTISDAFNNEKKKEYQHKISIMKVVRGVFRKKIWRLLNQERNRILEDRSTGKWSGERRVGEASFELSKLPCVLLFCSVICLDTFISCTISSPGQRAPAQRAL